MKKLLLLFISLILAASLTACIPGEQGEQGLPGNDGKDGLSPTVEISPDGYWIINGEKTGYMAIGQDGKDGKDGEDGKDGKPGADGIDGENGENGQNGQSGITPTISISPDGYWVINGEKTEHTAIGKDGQDGEPGKNGQDGKPGQDGVPPTIEISADGYWVINGEKTDYKAIGKDGEDGKPGEDGQDGKPGADGISPTISISPDGYWVINGEKTDYKADTSEECEHNYVDLSVIESTCTSRKVVKICDKCSEIINVTEEPTEEHTVVDNVCVVCGKEFYSNELAFELNPDGASYSVSGIGSCTNNNILIPPVYQGLPVTGITYSAFRQCYILTGITIPSSVTHIGNSAFFGCSNLTTVIFEENSKLTSIGDAVFTWCSSLTEITIDANNDNYKTIDGNLYTKDGKTLIQYAIGKKDTSFIIPDGVTSIGYKAFENCDSITDITIPASIEIIGEYAFHMCDNLTGINIMHGNLTSIGEHAFYNCYSLTDVNIPSSVTSIGKSAFSYCNSLNNINVDANNEKYKSIDGNLYTKDGKTLIQYTEGKKDTSFTIPDGVTSVGYSAFSYCTNLNSITIPHSVTNISDYAFFYCNKLISITIPNSVTNIGDSAFYHCINLTSIIFEENNKMINIEDYAFYDCSSLYVVYNYTSLALEIGSDANGSVAYYAKILINNGATSYADDDYKYTLTDDNFLFRYSTKYELIAYCGTEETVTLPVNIKGNEYSIYQMRGVINVIVPDGITSIGKHAFYNCYTLISVTIPDSVTSIGNYAFQYCYSLTSINIPDSVTTIGFNAFYSCDSLTGITIPDSVKIIDNNTFEYCENLTSIILPNTLIRIGYSAFAYTYALETIYYTGTESEWNAITIYDSSTYLANATRYYYSETEPTEDGNFWHYVNGEIVVW